VSLRGLRLRRATPEDEDLLLRWANDAEVRAMARQRDAITPAAHRAWFGRKLGDAQCRIWIAEADGAPVGQVRLDRSGASAEVDISVAPGRRGQGVGLFMLTASALADWPGLERLEATVRRENRGSLALFRRAGFVERGADVEFVYVEKRLSDARPG
jgi:UDP-2,4-diacetamido-2,4,6-trideoxy-beta-L-altropyranose hydrolase